jgi:hypothetical protein
LAAETVLNIIIQDVNDNIPVFTEVVSGTVLEHEPEGAPVMQVRAIDADGTSQHNQVSYFRFYIIYSKIVHSIIISLIYANQINATTQI